MIYLSLNLSKQVPGIYCPLLLQHFVGSVQLYSHLLSHTHLPITVNMMLSLKLVVAIAAAVGAHGDHDHDQTPMEGPHKQLWYNTLPGDGGM